MSLTRLVLLHTPLVLCGIPVVLYVLLAAPLLGQTHGQAADEISRVAIERGVVGVLSLLAALLLAALGVVVRWYRQGQEKIEQILRENHAFTLDLSKTQLAMLADVRITLDASRRELERIERLRG